MSSTTTAPERPLAYAPIAAARMLGIGRSTLYFMVARGELDAKKIGPKRTVILAESLHRLLDEAPRPNIRMGRAA